MKRWLALLLPVFGLTASAQKTPLSDDAMISPARPVPTGKAPAMKAKLVKDTREEKVYAIIFYKGDEALSGLTDFALAHNVADAHFTAIGAASSATLAWLDLPTKNYRRISVEQQVEVLALTGDIALFDSKPIVHMHGVLGKSDGNTVGGHVFELNVNPTLEVFMTVHAMPLKKRSDDVSGMKLIDPAS